MTFTPDQEKMSRLEMEMEKDQEGWIPVHKDQDVFHRVQIYNLNPNGLNPQAGLGTNPSNNSNAILLRSPTLSRIMGYEGVMEDV
nr:hypothetical protein [Tanacetum cinerariifolium]